MDKLITGEATHGHNPQSKFFEPLKPSKNGNTPDTLNFYLIISDPNSDSSLTPNWSVPDDPMIVPSSITISGFFSLLREKLPLPPSRSFSSLRRGFNLPATPNSSTSSTRAVPMHRRPKLGSVKLFLMGARNGLVLPMVKDDKEWEFRGGYARVDLMDKTDMEWRFFKELVLAAEGEFKVYVAIGAAESREINWGGLFGRLGGRG